MNDGALDGKRQQVTRDETLAVVAHELRTPLAAIVACVELLRQRGLADPSLRRTVGIIARSAAAQQRLIDDLFDHTRIARGHLYLDRERLDVGELVADVAEAMRPIAGERNIALDWQRRPVAVVHGDADRLRQVLFNLIANAIRHSSAGSRVEVQIEQRASEVWIRVRDSGVGIAAALLPHVFGRFVRGGQSKSPGLGLGLAISRAIVELHGGTIVAESDGEGLGATFTVRLPAMSLPATDAFAKRIAVAG